MNVSLNQPQSGNDMPRFGGIATMMRLKQVADASGLDACFVGIPLDLGTSNRSGTRYGPRQIRAESVLLRPYNMATRAAPFDSLKVADVGDIPTNPYSLIKSIDLIEQGISEILSHGCKPLSMGGDHTMTLPILRAIAKKHGPVGLIHVDAHADINDTMFGEQIAHGTPFRRAVEERLIDPKRTVQIGLRGTGYAADDFDWSREQGFKVYQADELWYRSLAPLMEEVRAHVGDGPVYITFDIDSLDPAFAAGTGTPEIGGLTTTQALEIVRGCWGLDVVGCDLVEVSPPFDTSGNTALTAANLLFELLCILPGVKRRN
ncbi:agmatinase [Sagittula stellata]|uniref:Agmatinase, putative n=1 Tax=Sagittula stellata (strain ATCC 700073 / DSM 11524 / E-37) TaxID=388399 RepID=A3K4T2_SAGS3|nr:agmatinase [Sagittula stellata]EBA07981.1 agmatinase, putative [Sagittula stellata E-37]